MDNLNLSEKQDTALKSHPCEPSAEGTAFVYGGGGTRGYCMYGLLEIAKMVEEQRALVEGVS